MARSRYCLIAGMALACAAPAAEASRRIIAAAHTSQNWGIKRSVYFYDPDTSPTSPLFCVFLGYEQPNNFEEISGTAVDPATGNVYVAAYDSGTAGSVEGTGKYTDTVGDYDLYRINFATVYNDWVAQGSTFRIYSNDVDFDASFLPPYYPAGTCVTLPGCIEKIGEIARNQSGVFYDVDLEFVDADTIVMLDNQTGDDCTPPCDADTVANDHVIRVLKRVSTSPGMASYNPSTNEGGWSQSYDDGGGTQYNTTESWESKILSLVNQDSNGYGLDTVSGVPTGRSEPIRIAYFKSVADNVEGVWVLESDGGGDDLAFLQITNWNGAAGNAYRELNVGTTSPYPRVMVLDKDPCVDPQTNDASADWVRVDPLGNLVIGVSGYYDTPRVEPRLVKRNVNGYDNGSGRIAVAGWTCLGSADLTGLPNDNNFQAAPYDTLRNPIHDQFTTIDFGASQLFMFDVESGLSAPANIADLYSRNLINGQMSNIAMNAANAFLLRTGLEFFRYPCSAPTIGSITPNTAPNAGTVNATIAGGGFLSNGTVVALVKPGEDPIYGGNISVAGGGNSLTCTFGMWGRTPGTYDLVVYTCGTARVLGAFTVTCAPVSVTGILPTSAASGTSLSVTITGSNFQFYGERVKLRKAGEADIDATNTWVANDHLSMTADFDLTGAAPGFWDVYVSTCSEDTLAGAFEITGGSACNTPPADLNGDGFVDGNDFGIFGGCFNGSGNPITCGEPCADLDNDGDVDGSDFGIFGGCFNGTGNPPNC